MTETGDPRSDFSTRKQAFERYRKAQETVRKAREAKSTARSLMFLQLQVEVYKLGALRRLEAEDKDPEKAKEALRKQEEEFKREEARLQEEWRKADAEEQQALAELDEASQELEELTVEPRVEGLKLRFEVSKLLATLSTGVVVGLATVSKLLLPSAPAHSWLSWLAYGAFLIALVGSLAEMRRISKRVENVLISGREDVFLGSFREKLNSGMAKVREWKAPYGPLLFGIYRAIVRIDRWAFPLGLILFVVFVTLNLGLGQVFADSADDTDAAPTPAPAAESEEADPSCLFAPPFC